MKKILLALFTLCATCFSAAAQGTYVNVMISGLDPACGILAVNGSFYAGEDSTVVTNVTFQMAGALGVYSAMLPTTTESVTLTICVQPSPNCGFVTCVDQTVYANTMNSVVINLGGLTDADMDGFTNDMDCDDSNAAVNPGAEEVCGDFLDNNCNGSFDEGCGGGETDNDNDGFSNNTDCDDSDANVNPGMPEICADGADNNCNGVIDEEGCTGGGSEGCNPEIILVSDSSLWNAEPGVVWILFPMAPSNTMTYLWTFGDGNSSTEPFPTNIYDVAGTYTVCLTVSGNGCTGTTCVTFTVTPEGDFIPGGMPMTGFTLNVVNAIPNSVSELTAEAIVEAYPCPFNDQLTIAVQSPLAGTGQLSCYDMTGALVAKEQINIGSQLTRYSITTSAWSAGAYTIELSTPAGSVRRVVMK